MSQPHVSPILPTSLDAVKMIQAEAAADNAAQVESESDLNQFFELSIFNPMVQAQRFRNFRELQSEAPKAKQTDLPEEKIILAVEEVDDAAARFQRNNYELNSKTLKILREKITADDTPEEILKKVLDVYPDPALADEAL